MSVKELHALTGKLIEQGRGNAEVGFDVSTIIENENPGATIHEVEEGKYRRIQGCDDAGPVGAKCPFLVLRGGAEFTPAQAVEKQAVLSVRRKALERAAVVVDAAVMLGEMTCREEKYIKRVLGPAIVDSTLDAVRKERLPRGGR